MQSLPQSTLKLLACCFFYFYCFWWEVINHIDLIGGVCMRRFFSRWLLSRFSQCVFFFVAFISFCIMFVFVVFFVFILLGVCSISCIWKLLFFSKFGKFLAGRMFLTGIPITYMLMHIISTSHYSIKLCSIFISFSLYSSACLISMGWFPVHWFFCQFKSTLRALYISSYYTLQH